MGTPTTLAPRSTAYIIWGSLLFGVVAFIAIASFVGPSMRRDGAGGPAVLAEISLAVAALGVLASRILPPRLRPAPGVAAEAHALSRNIVAAALCEGPSLFGTIAWMLTGSPWAAVAIGLGLAGLVACFPGDARWRFLGASAAPERPGGPSRMVR